MKNFQCEEDFFEFKVFFRLTLNAFGYVPKESENTSLKKQYKRFLKNKDISLKKKMEFISNISTGILPNIKRKPKLNELKIIYIYLFLITDYAVERELIKNKISNNLLQELDIKYFLLPMYILLLKEVKGFQINYFIPGEEKSSFRKLLKFLESYLNLKISLEKEIRKFINGTDYQDLDIEKDFDTLQSNLQNLIYEKTLPQEKTIRELTEILYHICGKQGKSNEISIPELEDYIRLSRFFQFLYKKSIENFGQKKTKKFIEHSLYLEKILKRIEAEIEKKRIISIKEIWKFIKLLFKLLFTKRKEKEVIKNKLKQKLSIFMFNYYYSSNIYKFTRPQMIIDIKIYYYWLNRENLSSLHLSDNIRVLMIKHFRESMKTQRLEKFKEWEFVKKFNYQKLINCQTYLLKTE